MKRGKFLVIAGVFIVGALVTAALIPAASQEAGVVHIEGITKYKTEKDTFLDLGKRGVSVGDRFIQVSPLFDEADRDQRIGTSALELVILKARKPLVMGSWNFELPDGEITAAGKIRIPVLRSETGDEVAITGGTGAYSDASGVLTIREEDRNGRPPGRHFYIFDINATVTP
jgi:hypothetical protein